MYLQKKDKLFIGIVSLLFITFSILGWLIWGTISLIVVLGVMLILLTTIHIETYRGIERQLKQLKARYISMNLVDVIQSRRSIRKFIEKPINQEHINKILGAASTAPSAGFTQPWHFIVIQNRELINQMEIIIRKKIEKEVPRILKKSGVISNAKISSYVKLWKSGSLFFPKAPITIAVLVEEISKLYHEPYVQYFLEKGLNRLEARNYMGLVEIQSVSAATENLLLTAHALGYGACWMRIPFMAKEELKKLLNVQFPWDLMALLPVGFTDPNYLPPQLKRKKIEEIMTIL